MWINAIDPFLLKELEKKNGEKKKEVKAKVKGPNTSVASLEPYRVGSSHKGKGKFVVPLSDLPQVKTRSSVQIWLKCGNCISLKSVKTSKIDKELSLIPIKKDPLKDKPKKAITPESSDDEIISFLTYLLKPYKSGKNNFVFLSLRENEGKYSLIPEASIESGVRETIYSLSSLLEMIPKSRKTARKRINGILSAYERAVDLGED